MFTCSEVFALATFVGIRPLCFFSVLEEKIQNEGGRKKHLRKTTFGLFLEKVMRVTK